MRGFTGIVIKDVHPEEQIDLQGKMRKAKFGRKVKKGEKVKVIDRKGLFEIVEKEKEKEKNNTEVIKW